MDLRELAALGLTAVVSGGGVGGVWAFLAARAKARADAPAALVTAAATFQAVLQGEAEKLLKGLSDRVETLQARVAVLEHENSVCRGENAALTQDVESLKTLLREKGIDIPRRPPPGSFLNVEGGLAMMFVPQTKGPDDE